MPPPPSQPHGAEALLKKKAKPDALSKAKLTPLHIASASGCTLLIPVLAKPEALESSGPGYMPVHAAAKAGRADALDALAAAGAKLDAKVGCGGRVGGWVGGLHLVGCDR